MSKANRRLRRAAARRAEIESARVQGCICEPDFVSLGRDEHGIPWTGMAHDDWCPLSAGHSEIILYPIPKCDR